jgi:hypothetical protein
MSVSDSTTPTQSSKRKSWRHIVRIHPAADLFPLMNDAELKELAEDIKKNGMQVPVRVWLSLDGIPYVWDGRNRLDALELAGFNVAEEWDDHVHRRPHRHEDWFRVSRQYAPSGKNPPPPPFAPQIVSMNIKRRHLDAAQRAYLVAAAYEADEKFLAEKTGKHLPVSKGGRGQKGDAQKIAEVAGVTKPTAQTQLEVRRDPELKAKVESGEMTAKQAGHVVRERKQVEREPVPVVREVAGQLIEGPFPWRGKRPPADPYANDAVSGVMAEVLRRRLTAEQVQQLKLRLNAYLETLPSTKAAAKPSVN